MKEEIDYWTNDIIEWIHNSFRRELDLTLEEENELELEIRARISNLFNTNKQFR